MQDHQSRSFLRADQLANATDGKRRTIRFPARFLRKALATVCSVTLVLQSSLALAAEVTTYSYDQARTGAYNVGRLTTVANTAATVEKDYDVQGNVIRQGWTVDSTAYEHTYTYAPHGEVLRRSFSDGELLPSATETYQYDEYGNLQSIPGLVTNITRTATFEPLVTTYANGVTETRSYDPNRQWLLSITSSNSGGTIFTESYTRNNKGLITTVASNRANGNWTYGYDTAYRLISATNLDSSSYTQTFTYDAADNITYNSQVGSYTYPSPVAARPHAVTQAGSLTYAYDANGNLTSGGGRTITYDGEERPTVVTALGQTTSFVYGPEGKRLKKTSAGDTTLYLGDDEEITSSGERIKHPYSDVRKVGTTINWMQRDHLSSVRLMTDATGAVISENHFRPYGERTDVQVSLTVPRESKGWIGERDDPETGLTYLNARYYDPVLARFISPDWFDPKDPKVGTNRYAYGRNNPISNKDPSGNFIDLAVDLASIAYDLAEISYDYATTGQVNPTSVAALGADIVAAAVPGLTGAGIAIRAGRRAEELAKVAKGASRTGKRAGRRAGGRGTACSFDGRTPVRTVENMLKAIKDIKVGDNVWAWDETTRKADLKKVLHVFSQTHRRTYVLTVADEENHEDVINASGNHPIYVEEKGWTRVDALEIGDRIPTASKDDVRVVRIEIINKPLKAYNLEVEDYNTFFVGKFGIWVHNAKRGGKDNEKSGRQGRTGSGKNEPHGNEEKARTTERQIEQMENRAKDLRQTPNKTKEQRKELEDLKGKIKNQKEKAARQRSGDTDHIGGRGGVKGSC